MNDTLELPQRLAHVVDSTGRKRRYGVHLVLFAFMVGALAGVQRLAHLEWLKGDAVVLKFLRLPSWPVRKVFSRALAEPSEAVVQRLQDLLTAVGLWSLAGVKSVVADADSSAVVTFGEQEGAAFGYTGKGRNRRRHHPLVGSVAGSRAVVHAKYRDGSGIDANEVVEFFDQMVRRIRSNLGDVAVTLRADSGFWSNAVGDWLLQERLPFVFAIGLRPAIKLMLTRADFRPLGGDDDIELAVVTGPEVSLDPRLRIVAIRRRVHDPDAPPQGKRIDWSPDWRYQALVTCTDWAPVDVWRFYNDRADCERIFKVAKHALGMSWLVGHSLTANTVAFLLRLLAYNADILFQLDAQRRAQRDGRPEVKMGLQARQHRIYNAAGRWLREHNRWVMRVSRSSRITQLWRFYGTELLSTA